MAMHPSGILCSAVTLFAEDGRVDADAFRAHLRMAIAAGCGGLVLNSVTGEGAVMTSDERARCLEIASEAAAGAVPVIAAIGVGSLEESATEARELDRRGATGIFLAVGGERTADVLDAVRGSSALPIILYNKLSAQALSVDQLGAIIEGVPGVAGVAEGNQAQVPALVDRFAGRAGVYCTRDSYILESAGRGASGAVSFTANVAPHAAVRLWQMASRSGNAELARELQQQTTALVTALLERGLPASIKSLMRALNVHTGGVRKPLADLTAVEAEHLYSRYSQLTNLFP